MIDYGAGRDQVAGEVNFADCSGRDCRQRCHGVFFMVALVDVKVVHVQQQAAAGAAREGSEEFGFAHCVVGEAHEAGDVFQQDGAAERVLHAPDPLFQQVERGVVQRQRQQVIQVAVEDGAPAEVF